MQVLYYLQSCYLDAALELLQSIKKDVSIHLLIELAPESMKSNIINIDSLDGLKTLEKFNDVINATESLYFEPYFEGITSVNFIIHHHKSAFSLQSFLIAVKIRNYISKFKIGVVHFDSLSSRSLFLLPFIIPLHKLVTIHDPIAHDGENSWKYKFVNKFRDTLINNHIFYSNYAKNQFLQYNTNTTNKLINLRLQPYTFYQQFKEEQLENPTSILFVGRLAYYKGIDLLLDAIPIVLNEFPNQQFIIAGKAEHYTPNIDLIKKYKNNIVFRNDFLTPFELVKLITNAKFLICPYRDATQSGVLMTSKALGKVVLATNTGAFSEYIINGENGILINPDVQMIAQFLKHLILNDNYKQLEPKVNNYHSKNISLLNNHFILNAYKNL